MYLSRTVSEYRFSPDVRALGGPINTSNLTLPYLVEPAPDPRTLIADFLRDVPTASEPAPEPAPDPRTLIADFLGFAA